MIGCTGRPGPPRRQGGGTDLESMPLDAHPEIELPDSLAYEVLEGLARLGQTVLVVGPGGRIVWQRDSAKLLPRIGHGASTCAVFERWLDPSRHPELHERLSGRGRLVRQRVELPTLDGSVQAAELGVARLDDGPFGRHFVVLLSPVGGDDRHDRELRHTIEYLGAILDAAPEPVLAVDRDGFVTYANPALERVLHCPAEEAVDRPVSIFVRAPEELDRIAAVLRRGESFQEDLELRRKDDAIVRISVAGSPLLLPDGTHVGAVLVLHDVDERRRVESELARKNAELEHYVHTVSHDLRTPLVSMLGFSRLLREDYGDRLDAKGLHFLERIELAARTMENLTHDLLELSRIGDRSERRALTDPLRVLAVVLAELKPRIESLGVAVDLPEAPPLLLCDRTRLYQVFANLIGNALEHMGPVPSPRIRISVEETPGWHRISVSDNGRGIDPEHHERIFEIFQSLGPRRDGTRGTGVGLAIVRKIAETHGGRVFVESAPGAGATFHLVLPRG